MGCNTPALTHNLDGIAEAIVGEKSTTLQLALVGMTSDLYLRRDNSKKTAYVDILFNNLLGLYQGGPH